jgi:hypothetical protein
MKKVIFAILLMMASSTGFAQLIAKKGSSIPSKIAIKATPGNKKATTTTADNAADKPINVVYARIDGKDTLLIVYLPEVDIDLMNRYYQITSSRQGQRLANNVRKVYPYAKLASDKLHEYDTLLAGIDSEAERRRMMKAAEQEITDQYTAELERLTFSQGAILIRLIDRETGNTSYQLVQELRGKVRAFFYQGFARLWGYNLKTEYDPKNNPEDDEIETIVTLLERGQI